MFNRDHHLPGPEKRLARGLPALLAGLAVAGAASASAAADPEFSGQVGVATENVAKGLGKSGGDPSVSGSVGVALNGFYAEFEASTVELGGGADAETIATVGYVREVGGYEIDLSVLRRSLHNTVAGYDDLYTEYQVDVSRDVGPVGARLRVNYTADGAGSAREAWWIEAQAGFALGSRTRASAAVGERISDTSAEYTAWNVGVKHKLTSAVAVDLRWYDTDEHALGERYEDRLVAALTFAF